MLYTARKEGRRRRKKISQAEERERCRRKGANHGEGGGIQGVSDLMGTVIKRERKKEREREKLREKRERKKTMIADE